jgi:hypothetical protein
MYKFLLPAFFLLAVSVCQAQNRAVIKGRIVDSLNAEPVEFATVAIVNVRDTTSSLISYTLSDTKGEFALHNLPAGIPLKVLITFVSYKPFRKVLTLSKLQSVDLGVIRLSPKQLQEVLITGERVPIVVKKDTIEFNAEAFKTRPNAVVEELLKKLPGIEVDNSGNITVNGKKVSKIMVDGREFFTNDPKIASKNLDASLIDKIQVYDDRENDPDHLIEESRVNKIINLKFKKALKKSIFGKVYAGAGTAGRFESGGLLNMFRDTLQVSLIGVGNNLNNTGFSREELYSSGGFNRSGDNALRNVSFGGQGSGIQTVATGGFNINYDYGKKLKLNLIYFFSHTQNINSYLTNGQQFLPPDTITTKSAYSSTSASNTHNVSFFLKWQPDTLTQIRYNPLLTISNNQSASNSISNQYSYLIPNISQNTNIGNSSGYSTQFQQSFSYYRRLKKKGESFTLSHSLSINPGVGSSYGNNAIISFTPTLPSDTLNRYNNRNSKNTDASLTASFRYPITKKLTADISLSGDYNVQGGDHLTYDFNPAANLYNIYIDSLSNNLNRNKWTETVHPGITYNFTKKISLVAGISTQWQQIDNQFNKNIPDLNQNYLFFLPNVRLSMGNLSVNYDANITQPSLNNLQPIRYVYSPLYTFTGNPNLKPTKRNNFSAYYYVYKPESQISINFYSGATIEQNSIDRQQTINNVGATTTMPINRNGQYNGYSGFGFGKKFKKIHDIVFGTQTNVSFSGNHTFFQLNQDEGFQNKYWFNATQQFSINWEDKLELDPSYTLGRDITKYTGVDYSNVSTTTQNVNTKLDAHLPQKIDIESSYTYTYNPLVTPGYQRSVNLVSMSIARQLLKKDMGQIKLSCYDIFNQNISAYRYASQNSVTDVQSQILKRYFLLTLQYKFNKSITK